MPQNVNVLIVDDHPFIIQGYKNVIRLYPNKKIEFTFFEAIDCQSGYEMILNSEIKFDLAFLDISMPSYPEKEIHTGEDIAKLLIKEMPDCKTFLLTMHSESLKVQSIIDEIDPYGLVIKNDLTFDSMILGLGAVMKGEKYYSNSVIRFLNNQQKEKIYVDVIDRQILHYLNKGIKYDDIPLYFTISSSNVKIRIEKMKELLGMIGSSDIEFAKAAKERGMLM